MRKLVEATFVSLDGVIESPERWALPLWGPADKDNALSGVLSSWHSRWVRNPRLCTDRQGVSSRALAKRAGRRPHDAFERTAEGGLGFVAESCRHFGDGQSPGA